MATRWQRVTLDVPYRMVEEEPPEQWDWAYLLSTPEEPILVNVEPPKEAPDGS